MENRSYALATGLFLLGLLVAAAAAGTWLAGKPLDRVAYRVVSLHSVSGLNPQGQVRYRGISVGRVASIELDGKDPRRILIDIEVNKSIPITRGTYAKLGQEGITGIAYVHLLDEGGDAQAPTSAKDGVVEITLRQSAMDDIFEAAATLSRDAKEVLAGLNTLLAADNRASVAATLVSLRRITAELETVSRQLPLAVARVDRNLEGWLSTDNQKLARDSLLRLKDTAQELPALAQEARKLVDDTRQVAAQVGRLTGEASQVAAQVGRLTGEAQSAAGAVRQDTLPKVNALAESVERGAERIGRLAYELERRPDSVVWGRPANRPGPGEPGFQ